MSSSNKTAKMSIADKAARVVSTWSSSKKAAFEQRTGLTLTKNAGSGDQRTHGTDKTSRSKSNK